MKTVAIIPARGGSKGIPGKNIMDFCGRPLLSWSIVQAREALSVERVYVSSDDREILEVARSSGAEPIVRPEALASDTASSESALDHALEVVASREGSAPDIVVFLQATSPLREPEDIDGAVRELTAAEADSLFSMAVLDDFCLWTRKGGELQGLSYDPLNRGRRQDRPPLYLENGSIYVFRPRTLSVYGNRLGGRLAMFEMPFWKSCEIDKPEDVDICRYYFEKHLLSRWRTDPEHLDLSASQISLLVYDFDGVMTDNRVLVLQDGTEGVRANRADGLGVSRLRGLGLPQLILSTETNPVVRARAAKLGLEVIDSCRDKRQALADYCREKGYDPARVVFVGNDVNDLEAMRLVGLPAAPADAHPEVLAAARLVTRCRGGDGVIKELSERIRPA
ncbi:MAG: acylneuraminate cytidylyltransferase [Proteobacteria bacterium]|nr:acylneuraminate cytidylyltransferase [Pseudomonadota bacterium]